MRLWSVLSVLPVFLVACGSASTVSLSVQLSDEAIQVQDSAFGASLSGGFRLRLELGSEASGSTEVTPGNFELQTEAGERLADLRDAVPDTDYPIELNKGESKQVGYMLNEIEVDRAAVCAGRVRIVGSVMDTLKGATVPVHGVPITPDC